MDNFFLKAWNRDLDFSPILQSRIHAWFKSPSFYSVTNTTKTLPGTNHQVSLLLLQLMSSIIPDKALSIFLNNPTYKRKSFSMWGSILKKYYPIDKDALFESIYAL